MKKIFVFLLVFLLIALSVTPVIIRTNDPFSHVTLFEKHYSKMKQYYGQKIKWNNCYNGFKCASYKVPIDYDNLKLGSFDIATMMHPAQHRIGTLVINPGGPGGSGVDYAYSADYAFTSNVYKNFDLVGFDPRGAGRSDPIKCLTNQETDEYYASSAGTGKPSVLIAKAKEFAAKCIKQNPYLKYFTTANTARDMDILRSALGETKLNYLGKSYGTYLGTLYVQLFPSNVGKFVLDGAVDPTISSENQSLGQAVGFDQAYDSFAKTYKTFPKNRIEKLLNSLEKKPMQVGNRQLTSSLAVYGIVYGLYDRVQGWPELNKALTAIFNNNGEKLLQLSDAYTGRQSDGSYQTNEAEALEVIACNDFGGSNYSNSTKFTTSAPLFGPYVANSDLNCQYLPTSKKLNVKEKLNPATTVLVIGTTKDPATPYVWAEKLNSIMGNSRLVSLNSDGHTGYNRESKCVDSTVENYLISGQIPAQNRLCPAL